jgi:glucans biosynthesis protein C
LKKTAVLNREVSIDYLRSFITILVLAHHSSLAYTTFAHADPANPLLSTAPIVDSRRWIFFDYAENFNDVFFMSLMFLLSGLFVWPILRRKGVVSFLKDRIMRLGVPFVIGVTFVMPLAYFPAWLAEDRTTNYLQFWFEFITRNGWSPGPLWFLWVLLFFDMLAALIFLLAGKIDLRFIGKSFRQTLARVGAVCRGCLQWPLVHSRHDYRLRQSGQSA